VRFQQESFRVICGFNLKNTKSCLHEVTSMVLMPVTHCLGLTMDLYAGSYFKESGSLMTQVQNIP